MTRQEDPDVRLGRMVRERRQALGMSQNELGVAAGISDTWISQVELGRGGGRQGRKIRQLEDALGWVQGSVAAVRAGGKPTVQGPVRHADSRGGTVAAVPDETLVAMTQQERADLIVRLVRLNQTETDQST